MHRIGVKSMFWYNKILCLKWEGGFRRVPQAKIGSSIVAF